jgi:hypothetical protein
MSSSLLRKPELPTKVGEHRQQVTDRWPGWFGCSRKQAIRHAVDCSSQENEQ